MSQHHHRLRVVMLVRFWFLSHLNGKYVYIYAKGEITIQCCATGLSPFQNAYADLQIVNWFDQIYYTPQEIGDIDKNGICLPNFTIIINIHLFKPFNYFYIKYQQLLILIININ